MSKPLPYAAGRLPRVSEVVYRSMFVQMVKRYGPNRGRQVFYATLRSVSPHPPLVTIEGYPFPKRLVEEAVKRGEIRKTVTPGRRVAANQRAANPRWTGPIVKGFPVTWSVPNQRWFVTSASAPVGRRPVLFSGTTAQVSAWITTRRQWQRLGARLRKADEWIPKDEVVRTRRKETGTSDLLAVVWPSVEVEKKHAKPSRNPRRSGPTRTDIQRYRESCLRAGMSPAAAEREVRRAFGRRNPLTNREADDLLERSDFARRVAGSDLRAGHPNLARHQFGRAEGLATAVSLTAKSSDRKDRGASRMLRAEEGGFTAGLALRGRRPKNPLESHKPGCRCIYHSGSMFKKGGKR